MKQATVVVGVLAGVGLAGLLVGPVTAQSRVVVPIIIQAPRASAPSAGSSSVQVTTRTVSPQPGVTGTQVTVRDTTGIRGYSSVVPSALPPAATGTQVTVRDTTGIRGFSSVVRPGAVLATGGTQVTVRDTTGIQGFSSVVRPGAVLATGTQVTVRDTTGIQGFSSVRPGAFPSGASGTLAPARSVTIRSDGPLDLPIIVLTD